MDSLHFIDAIHAKVIDSIDPNSKASSADALPAQQCHQRRSRALYESLTFFELCVYTVFRRWRYAVIDGVYVARTNFNRLRWSFSWRNFSAQVEILLSIMTEVNYSVSLGALLER